MLTTVAGIWLRALSCMSGTPLSLVGVVRIYVSPPELLCLAWATSPAA